MLKKESTAESASGGSPDWSRSAAADGEKRDPELYGTEEGDADALQNS